ncbi:MAG TPA: Hpt domain-containing protein [Methanocorpusculum sp.]|nr:Hpt domain-containing protein [Methanocorpusculum sp.]
MMNVKELYTAIHGDYEGVLSRMMKDERIEKYLGKFLESPDYDKMHEALAAQNYPDAFRFVHNLKGISLNMGFTELAKVSSDLCETMRPGVAPKVDITDMLAAVDAEYAFTVAEINKAKQA